MIGLAPNAKVLNYREIIANFSLRRKRKKH